MTSLPASDPGSAAVWGSKRINPRPQSCLCLTWSGYLFKRRRRFKTVIPCAPFSVRCIGHGIRTWSAVCSVAPNSQFRGGARLHLCMDELNCPTPVCKRLTLTQASFLGKVHSNRPGTGTGTDDGYENAEPGCILTMLRVSSIFGPLRSVNTMFGKAV